MVLGLVELSPNPAMGKAEEQNLKRLRAVGQVTVRQERQLGAAMICLRSLQILDGCPLWKGIP